MQHHAPRRSAIPEGLLLVIALATGAAAEVPSFEEAMLAKRDVWGEAAMAQPNGPSYEFFAPLLPPPRYVNADFRHYPIVLSAPNAKVKARLISNGSGVNLKGGARSWNDVGTPATFRVGPDEFVFGSLPDRLSEPTLAEGWLPIPEIRYRHPSPFQSEGNVPINQKRVERVVEVYSLEAFASTEAALADSGVVFVQFALAAGDNGFVAVDMDAPPGGQISDSKVTNDKGQVIALFDATWKRERGRFVTRLKTNSIATLIIATKPLEIAAVPTISPAEYARQRAGCVATWRQLLARGTKLETPEPLVNNALRHLLCQNFQLINGDSIRYSAGNQYDKLYEAEGSDAALAMMVWGYEADTRRLLGPLFDFTRKGLEYHQAGFKLNNLCRLYWQTRDASLLSEFKPRWEREAQRLDNNRTEPNGLYPKEQYCGDIHTFVYSLNVASKAWRAMRDLAAVLRETGDAAGAKHYADEAAAFRKTVLTAIEKSVRRETTPPFVPVSLYGDEPAHDPILHTRIGSYWNIIIGYTIMSGIFLPGSAEENWIPRYQEEHGGLCMGMLRSGGDAFVFWTGEHRINPLYGTRYVLDGLRRDGPERALVSFYGMLAQGFTRNTFVCGEGCSLAPVDGQGRFFYCPPNSAANAHFLSMLRYLLVQDWDLDDDGKPETLRLGFATPKRWLEDGKVINVERAPTAFGPVSFRLESRLQQGQVLANLALPGRDPAKRTLLRVRVPNGWRVTGAQAGAVELQVDSLGTMDLSSLRGTAKLNVRVAKAQ